MIILLSPSKTQHQTVVDIPIDIPFMDQTMKLFNEIGRLNKVQMRTLFHIKGKLLDQTYELYQSQRKHTEGIKAIQCYQGIVFDQMQVDAYSASQMTYLNQHLIILSAMYGLLKPNHVIWPYRLDMTIKIQKINLYTYWKSFVNQYLANEDIIINLASNEFSKLLDKQNLSKTIHIHFKERLANGSLKVIGVRAKIARGMMANLFVKHEIEEIDSIKSLEVNGYCFEKDLSDESNYYFIRNQ